MKPKQAGFFVATDKTIDLVAKGEKEMPLVEINVFEDELTEQQKRELIQKVTNAVTTVTSEKLRDVTWVIINEIKSGDWGVGGKALGVDDVRKMIRGG